MFGSLLKGEIVGKLESQKLDFVSFCSSISDEVFFRQPAEKWSIAQNVTHLITSAHMTRVAYRLPKFMVKIYAGHPNRPSRSYDELVARYKIKLQQGRKANGRFIPKPVDPLKEGKGDILVSFGKAMEALGNSIDSNWTDGQLDQYLAPHPLMGKITLRELGYFTIYHTEHHLSIIKQRLND